MEIVSDSSLLKIVVEIVIFIILMFIFEFIYNAINDRPHRLLNLNEYFPEEEAHSLRQIFYLIMMGLIFVDILYIIIFTRSDIIYFVLYDIALSLYLAIKLDKSTIKNKILLLLLIPYGSLYFIMFGISLVGWLDLIHIPVFIYFIKIYYDKFREYTESNGLGITIILLFAVVFISFLMTQFTENVNALDSLVMVSNAFTSNGYAVLGHTIAGKINSIILVWSGYLLSGVGTATLAAGILIRHFNNKVENLEDELRKNNEKLDYLIKKANEDEKNKKRVDD